MSHFRTVMTAIDVDPLLAQIAANPQLWNICDLWTRGKPQSALSDIDDIVLRYNRSSAPALNDWDHPAFQILSEAQPIIMALMAAVQGEHLGRVIISRMRPGQIIPVHTDDPMGIPLYAHRYQIPLSVKPGAIYTVDGESIYMQPGNVYWFNSQLPHWVENNSQEDRISMLADIRPFRMYWGTSIGFHTEKAPPVSRRGL